MFLVGTFANIPFKGNPAGVCVVDEYPRNAKNGELLSLGWDISFIYVSFYQVIESQLADT